MTSKVKTMTVKEAYNRANNFSDESIGNVFETLNIRPVEEELIAWNFLRNGQHVSHIYCPECGTEWEEETGSEYALYVCPCCGNISHINSYECHCDTISHDCDCNSYVAVLDEDKESGYLLLGQFLPVFVFKTNSLDVQQCLDNGNYDFLHGIWALDQKRTMVNKFVFLIDKGFRVFSESGKSLVSIAPHIQNYWDLKSKNVIKDHIPVLLDFASSFLGTSLDENTVLEQMVNYTSDVFKQQKQKIQHKADRDSELNENFHPEDISDEKVWNAEKADNFSMGIVTDTFADFKKIRVYCGSCRNISYITTDNNSRFVDAVCPSCGQKISFITSSCAQHSERRINAMNFELMPETGYLVGRIFAINEVFSDKISREIEETERVFFTDKKIISFCPDSGNSWKKFTLPSDFSGRRSPECVLLQEKSEIKDLVDRSCLKYSGVASAWGLDGSAEMEEIGSFGKKSYISQWYKKPYLEKIIKAGLTSAADDIIRDISEVHNPNGNSLTEILGICKPVFRIAREEDLSISEMQEFQRFYNMDHTLTAQDYLELKSLGRPFEFEQLSRDYNMSFRKIRGYLDSCYSHQCIEKREALQIWRDYLRMAEKLKYNLNDKDKKFPSSLKKEHDIATFAYKRVEDEVNQKTFALQYQKNKFYEYANGNLLVKVPETPEEIISEAKQQKNCVASYVNMVCNGETVVAFIRRKEEPEKSYVTMEICCREIRQLRAFANASVKDRETLDFVKEFALKKNLLMNY